MKILQIFYDIIQLTFDPDLDPRGHTRGRELEYINTPFQHLKLIGACNPYKLENKTNVL
jgi:hypothetical protein